MRLLLEQEKQAENLRLSKIDDASDETEKAKL